MLSRLGSEKSGRNHLLLLIAVAAAVLLPQAVCAWRLQPKPVADISAAAACRAASQGIVWQGDSIYEQLQKYLDVNGPELRLPRNTTDLPTAATIMQLAAPRATLVLDPLLYLRALQRPPSHEAAAASGSDSSSSSRGAPKQLPRLVHMTLRDKRALTPLQLLSLISWGRHNPGWALLLYDDDDMETYAARHAPGFLPTFRALRTPVERSDAWRYAVLCAHGGVYADTDTIAAAPVASWLPANTTLLPRLIVGVENRFHSQAEAEEASYVSTVQITQWVMAAAPRHPVPCRMNAAIAAFIAAEAADGGALERERGHDASVLLRTGPGIWSAELHAHLRRAGSSPEAISAGGQVGDVLVLPTASFGCNMRYWGPDNNASLVLHGFANSWKRDHHTVGDAKRAARQAKESAAKREAALHLLQQLLMILMATCSILSVLYAALTWAGAGRILPGRGGRCRGPAAVKGIGRAAQAGGSGSSSPPSCSPRSPARTRLLPGTAAAAASIGPTSRLQQTARGARR